MGATSTSFGWTAARESKSRQIERRVRVAVDALVAEGKVPSFYVVSERAKVARSTLYRRPELRALVDRARDTVGSGATADVEASATVGASGAGADVPRFVYGIMRLSVS